MTRENYTTSFTVDRTPEEIFAAVNNVRGWWSEDVEGSTTKVGDVWFYQARDLHRCTVKVVESEPGRKVAWQVLDNTFNFTEDKTEWIGSTMVFDIGRGGDGTELRFTHVGLSPDDECYDVCHDAWGTYIHDSLKSLIDTGRGHPNSGSVITAEKAATDDGSFTTRFTVAATPAIAFAAINNPRAWWSGEIDGGTERLGDEFTYRYKDLHFSRQKIVELVPDKRVVWLVTEATMSFLEDTAEWEGTTIAFDIAARGDSTEVVFTHVGLRPAVECYGACTDAWTSLITGSLRQLIETGRTEHIDL